MDQTQRCVVCDISGIIVDGPIYVRPDQPEAITLVAQCPRCKRWICNRHGEPLYGSGLSGFIARRFKSRAVPLGCPFDYNVILGSEDV